MTEPVVQVTNTINITTILAIISAVSIAGGAFIVMFFKLARQVLKEIFELRIELIKQHIELNAAQTAQLEACIHKIPGHPENPLNQESTPNG
jgi:Na+/melibiose symporter-like transporter